MNISSLKIVSLKDRDDCNEKLLQEYIAKHPESLGLGDIELRSAEKIVQSGGRLDLLFQNSDEDIRYECEIQLGKTDESHIIRTIEYWDLEAKRYPQYKHIAVLIAEDVESRFLNVLQLFNRHIPIIVFKMTAVEKEDGVSLFFTKVVDECRTTVMDDEEDSEPTDRNYWEQKSCSKMLGLTDELLLIINQVDAAAKLNYKKNFIGLSRNGLPKNYCHFKPKKSFVNMFCKSIPSEVVLREAEELGLAIDPQEAKDRTRIRFAKIPSGTQVEVLKKIIDASKAAYGL